MVQVELRSLIEKLNESTKHSLEAAAGLCLSRTNYDVEIEHWLMKLLEQTDSDIAAITQFYGIDVGRLSADLTRAIDGFKTGNSRPPSLSPRIVDVAREAWVYGSLNFGAPFTRSGHILGAMLSDESLRRQLNSATRVFEGIAADDLRKNFVSITGETQEAKSQSRAAATSGEAGAPARKGGALQQYTNNLTQQARDGKIDAVLGRDGEIRQIVDILTRRRQNNPILTGEAGVGKTAVVEGFALRIAKGDVPPALQNVELLSLDLGLLQAGASVKGEFENRLRSVIDEVKGSTTPIILFIDEAHTLIGAGGQAGQNDAANLLKPALARGELRTIAATTWLEYKKYFEKDPALTRRFQVVKVEEPSEATAIEMMRGLAPMLQKHHGVRILDEALVEAVKLSHRYIPDRQMPDKCVSVLDTACAKVGISQNSTPASVEDSQRRLDQIDVTLNILNREQEAGANHQERIDELLTEKDTVNTRLQTLNQQWASEREIAAEIAKALAQLHSEDESLDKQEAKQRLQSLEEQLKQLQGESPLLHVRVDAQAVAEVIAGWTGIPVGRMVSDEIQSVLKLGDHLEQRVIGQRHALEAIAKSIRTSRARLTDPNKPIGVFLMVGTSGVGKTETALALADLLYGGEQNMTVINMSEFKEEHKVSLLMGSPPGYVGYGEGGVLTEAVRRKPYSIVLLDEMEKAHSGVQDIFYQVFDKGNMKDGEGRDIDFKNTVIIMTSNLGSETISKLCSDEETMPEPDMLLEAVRPDLLSYFKPAFLGRTTSVCYYPLHDNALSKIIALKLNKIGKRIYQNYKADFEYGDDVLETITSRCQEVESGARNIDNILNDGLLPKMSEEFLSRVAVGEAVKKVTIGVGDDDSLTVTVN
ncbi:MAG: type VI secretion system ATPase TssH [Gammaproteobacteria bacterium]|nr:type VI secretion system ATPase TssH [Gammaproteobacteria bacterium]